MERKVKAIPADTLFQLISESLRENRNAIFTVTGNSMWPFISHCRDQVEVTAVEPSQLKKGDIVLFKTPSGVYILHRIMKLTPKSIITAGDGNIFMDGEFPKTAVLAKVVRIIRKGKNINCNSLLWRFIFTIWRITFPMRRFLLKTILFFCRIRKNIKD